MLNILGDEVYRKISGRVTIAIVIGALATGLRAILDLLLSTLSSRFNKWKVQSLVNENPSFSWPILIIIVYVFLEGIPLVILVFVIRPQEKGESTDIEDMTSTTSNISKYPLF